MLTETFLAASASALRLTSSNSTLLKDAGIFHHSARSSNVLLSTLKKSHTAQNCVAVNATHVFAAQIDKAVVHVYNRVQGIQEVTVPFPQRVRSLITAADGSLVILGAEDGSVSFWEVNTGRQKSSSQSHLGPVVALAVDINSNFLLSGSEDAVVHVWGLFNLLSLQTTASGSYAALDQPCQSLSGHQKAINAIVTGHSATTVDIAISVSSDETAIIWDYQTGTRLRTVLLPTVPLCIAMDVADRAFYVGLSDGSIQLVQLFEPGIWSTEAAATPIQTTESNLLRSSALTTGPAGAVLSLSLSFDGTTLLSGHEGGKILAWDVSCRRLRGVAVEYPGSPITTLCFLPPSELPSGGNPNQSRIVKPRLQEVFSGPRTGSLSGTYHISSHLRFRGASRGTTIRRARNTRARHSETRVAEFLMPRLPQDILEHSIHDLTEQCDALSSAERRKKAGTDDAPGFIGLEATSATDGNQAEMSALRNTIAHLRRVQALSHSQIERLTKERTELRRCEELASSRI